MTLCRLMVPLQSPNFATLANLVSAIAIISSLRFTQLQLRRSDRKRRDLAAAGVARTIQTLALRRAVERVLRAEKQNVNAGEWWQWLHDFLDREGDPGNGQGAHLAYGRHPPP